MTISHKTHSLARGSHGTHCAAQPIDSENEHGIALRVFGAGYSRVATVEDDPHETCEVFHGRFRVSGGKNSTFHPHNPHNSASANYSQHRPRVCGKKDVSLLKLWAGLDALDELPEIPVVLRSRHELSVEIERRLAEG